MRHKAHAGVAAGVAALNVIGTFDDLARGNRIRARLGRRRARLHRRIDVDGDDRRRCLLYPSDAADEGFGVDLGVRRLSQPNTNITYISVNTSTI